MTHVVELTDKLMREKAGRLFARHEYVSPRKVKQLNSLQETVRYTAFALADKKRYQQEVFASVAPMLAAIVGKNFIPPVNLVPVPDSRGDTRNNLALCVHIRDEIEGVYVQDILEGEPHMSLCQQHQHELPLPCPEELKIRVKKNRRKQGLKNVLLVDNVLTSGTTYLACRDAILRSCEVVGLHDEVDILVWADARETIHQTVRRVGNEARV